MPFESASLLPEIPSGEVLDGRFEILDRLGEGAFGSVYRARDSVLKDEVAIKLVVRGTGPHAEKATEQLLHEYKVRRRINDTRHIIKASDPRLCEWKAISLVLLPMEVADGGTLRGWLKRRTAEAALTEGLHLLRHAAEGVRAIHEEGLLHLDLKPENILLSGGVAKITDFGLGRFSLYSDYANNPDQLLQQGWSFRRDSRQRSRSSQMTTFIEWEKTCGVCNRESKQASMVSSSAFGHPDLDGRPPIMLRDTMRYWVMECPHCGYCGRSIGQVEPSRAKLALSRDYRELTFPTSLPFQARRFLRWGWFAEGDGELEEAGWARLFAAWECDDRWEGDLAQECRKQAADNLTEILAERGELKPPFEVHAVADEVVVADVLRRAGRFEEAIGLAKAALKEGVGSDGIQVCLEFEVRLGQEEDLERHGLVELFGEKEA